MTAEIVAVEFLRPVPGYSDYWASVDGRVWSGKRGPPRPLALDIDGHGYPRTWVVRAGRRIPQRVHKLVALAFLGPRPAGHEINHIDGQKTNASAANLEYVTPRANKDHAIRTGLSQHGERNPQHKATEEEVREIRSAQVPRRGGVRCLAERFRMSESNVRRIRSGKTWVRSLKSGGAK